MPDRPQPDRRYTDEEARHILARAAEAEAQPNGVDAADQGWTLDAIQRVGAEAGLDAASIAGAAAALELEKMSPRGRRYLGLPIAVTRSVPLERPLGDDDWRRLVFQLRDTFEAQGREHTDGARREWWNGNLRVTHEPIGDGAVLALRTRKGDVRGLIQLGLWLLVGAVVVSAITYAFPTGDPKVASTATVVGVLGVVLLLLALLRLPAWAGTRARQFEALGRFARTLVGGP